MALKFFDNVRHAIATTGTGDVTLGTAPAGWRTFSSAGAVDDDVAPYELRDGNEWEIGFLTLSGGVGTGSRDVKASSNADSEINLSGSATLTCVHLARLLPYFALEDKSGASPATYSAGFDDRGKTFVFSDDNDSTLNIAAASTLDDRWWLTVMARGGDVTIDPNGSETVEGQSTFVVPNGSEAVILCDGTAFRVAANKIPGIQAARFKTTANVNLAGGGLADGTTHDGVTAATGNVAFVEQQDDKTENGIYLVPASGAASRLFPFTNFDAYIGLLVSVSEGTNYKNSLWRCISNEGGTDIEFVVNADPVELVASTSFPAANSVDITDIPKHFKKLIIKVTGVSPNSNVALIVQVSDDNGSSFKTTGYGGQGANNSGTHTGFSVAIVATTAIAAADTATLIIEIDNYAVGLYPTATMRGTIGSAFFSAEGAYLSALNVNAVRLSLTGSADFDAGTYEAHAIW